MLFTSDVCLPEIMRQERAYQKSNQSKSADEDSYLQVLNSDHVEIIPYVCFYNGMSFLKRLPTEKEIKDQARTFDLEHGFKMKDSFISELKNDTSKCQANLQGMYDDNVDGRFLDGLVPFQEKYIGNSYIDVYNYFCKRDKDEHMLVAKVNQMYSTGLELMQKLDKIIDYDKCNPDSAKLVGLKDYCLNLFQSQQFYFWEGYELKQNCANIEKVMALSQQKDECAVLNEHIYSKYHEKQNVVLK